MPCGRFGGGGGGGGACASFAPPPWVRHWLYTFLFEKFIKMPPTFSRLYSRQNFHTKIYKGA